jgi:hypothetical protein
MTCIVNPSLPDSLNDCPRRVAAAIGFSDAAEEGRRLKDEGCRMKAEMIKKGILFGRIR